MQDLTPEFVLENKLAFERFFENATLNSLRELRDNPIDTLKAAGISIINFIDTSKIAGFSRAVRRFAIDTIEKFGNGFKRFGKCNVCKLGLISFVYYMFSKLNITIDDISNYLGELNDLLQKFFDESTEVITQFIRANDNFFTRVGSLYTVDSLAEKICTEFGAC